MGPQDPETSSAAADPLGRTKHMPPLGPPARPEVFNGATGHAGLALAEAPFCAFTPIFTHLHLFPHTYTHLHTLPRIFTHSRGLTRIYTRLCSIARSSANLRASPASSGNAG